VKIPRHWFVATTNAGKLREIVPMIEEYFSNGGLSGLRLSMEGRAARDADETETTFAGNALIKARALAQELLQEGRSDFCVLADDSGLAVDALGGRPGVHSARYAGDHAPSDANVRKLLQELAPFPSFAQRTSRYHCALALVHSDSERGVAEHVAEGTCEGCIGTEPRGDSGFGYDPVFVVTDADALTHGLRPGLTMSEIDYAVKNRFSHRRRAFEALRQKVF